MRPITKLILFAGLCGLSGCATGPRASLVALQHRAAVDLSCPAHQLQLQHIDSRLKVVSGCNRQIVYVEDCFAHGNTRACTWLNDSPSPSYTVKYVAPTRDPLPPAPAGQGPSRAYQTDLDEPATTPTEQRPKRRVRTDLFGSDPPPEDVLERRR